MSVENIVAMVFSAIALTCSIVILIRDIKKEEEMKRFWQWLQETARKIMSWLRADGIQHLAVSALIVVAFGWIRPMWIAPLIALAIGIAKEVYDYVSGKGTAEWHDVICDLLGIALGVFFVFINSLA